MTETTWEQYWQNSRTTWFGRVCTFYRYHLIAPYLSRIIEKYFPKKGVFVDCGSGSSESSERLKKHNRTYIALDYEYQILKHAKEMKNIDYMVNADILKMPFKNNIINGIWNLGVMEHFDEKELKVILGEFHRVMKKGSYAVFFWPPAYGVTEMFLNSLSFLLNKILRIRFWYTPEEKTKIKSTRHIKSIIGTSKFRFVKAYFSPRDFFTYMVVVCRKE